MATEPPGRPLGRASPDNDTNAREDWYRTLARMAGYSGGNDTGYERQRPYERPGRDYREARNDNGGMYFRSLGTNVRSFGYNVAVVVVAAAIIAFGTLSWRNAVKLDQMDVDRLESEREKLTLISERQQNVMNELAFNRGNFARIGRLIDDFNDVKHEVEASAELLQETKILRDHITQIERHLENTDARLQEISRFLSRSTTFEESNRQLRDLTDRPR